jgi:predicted peptidase
MVHRYVDDINKIEKYGIPKFVKEGKDFNFIIISPQCPSGLTWVSENWFLKTFEEIKAKYRIDTNKVYLTGMSLGGEGTWYIAEKYPDVFAAIAPVCGRSSNIKSIKKDIDKISNLPVWLFHGEQDKTYAVTESDDIYKKLVKINKDVKYTRYPNLGHWETHDSTYKNDELYDWFLDHSIK